MNPTEKVFLSDVQPGVDRRNLAIQFKPERFESIHNQSAYALIERVEP